MKNIYNELIDKPIGTVMSKHVNTQNCLIFVKSGKYKIDGYLCSYQHIRGSHGFKLSNTYESSLFKKGLVTLYNDYFEVNLKDDEATWVQEYFFKHIMRIVSYNWVFQNWFITFADGTKMVPYNKMKIDYNGNPYGKHPKKYIKANNVALDEIRNRRNAYQRSRYHNIKAVERLNNAYFSEGTTDVSKLPISDVFKLWNVSHRRLLIDYYGMDTIIASLKHKVIDKDVINNNPYELITVEIPDLNETTGYRIGNYLRMVNPSTDEIHFEGVANEVNDKHTYVTTTHFIDTVSKALAWRNGDSLDNYNVPHIIT